MAALGADAGAPVDRADPNRVAGLVIPSAPSADGRKRAQSGRLTPHNLIVWTFGSSAQALYAAEARLTTGNCVTIQLRPTERRAAYEADFESDAPSGCSAESGGNPDAICSLRALPFVTQT